MPQTRESKIELEQAMTIVEKTQLGLGSIVTLWGAYKRRIEDRNDKRIAEFDRLHKLAQKQDHQACEDYKRKLEAKRKDIDEKWAIYEKEQATYDRLPWWKKLTAADPQPPECDYTIPMPPMPKAMFMPEPAIEPPSIEGFLNWLERQQRKAQK